MSHSIADREAIGARITDYKGFATEADIDAELVKSRKVSRLKTINDGHELETTVEEVEEDGIRYTTVTHTSRRTSYSSADASANVNEEVTVSYYEENI